MIEVLLNKPEFEYDIHSLIKAFFPEQYVGVSAEKKEYDEKIDIRMQVNYGEDTIQITWQEIVHTNEDAQANEKPGQEEVKERPGETIQVDFSDRVRTKNQLKQMLYRMLCDYTKRTLPWGNLTGIRPTKIPMKLLEEGKSREEIYRYMKDTYLASDEKIELATDIAERENAILKKIDYDNGYSLYIGIPFCPTTCLYCSFTSFPVSRFGDRMRAYLDALYKELAFVAKHHRDKKLTTIYIGGGTPTALDEECLSKLMNMIHELFPVEESEEFTVESGRPDSITKEKFRILKEAGVTRISINPQTMHQETLDLIGRAHTVEQTKEAFLLARECGFDNINMDIITGLPGESLSYVHETLDEIFKLRPESLTVHSLAIKRAAHLNIEMEKYQGMVKGSTNEMLRLVDEYASNMGMEAYYMYRQKNIPGNLENIGYCVPDKECLYNILIMEEKQDIISCGAGASSKYVFEQGRIERTENVKNLDHYINRIDEMIDRKRKYL